MSTDLELINRLISKDFNLDEEQLRVVHSHSDIHEALKKVVSYLLDRNLERLLQALYRIDINELKVKSILASSAPDKIASEISSLIIAREIQKIETRKKYSQ